MVKTLVEVLDVIHPRPPDFIQPSRFYIHEGELETLDEKTKRKKKRYLFLFNDLLLITKKEGSRRHWLRIYANLRNDYVHVEDARQGTCFKLVCRTRSFTFYPYTEGEKETWMVLLNGSITGLCEKQQNNPQPAPVTFANTSPSAGWTRAAPNAPPSEDFFDEPNLTQKEKEKRQTFNFLDFDDVPTTINSNNVYPPSFNQPQQGFPQQPQQGDFQSFGQQSNPSQQGFQQQGFPQQQQQQQPYGFQPQYQAYGQPQQGFQQQPPQHHFNPFLDDPSTSPTANDQRARVPSFNPFSDDPNTKPSFQN